jgi:hypothetical protein
LTKKCVLKALRPLVKNIGIAYATPILNKLINRKGNVMNSSSTQLPFMLAGFIAILLHSLMSEPTIDNNTGVAKKVESTTKVVMLESARNGEAQKIASR